MRGGAARTQVISNWRPGPVERVKFEEFIRDSGRRAAEALAMHPT